MTHRWLTLMNVIANRFDVVLRMVKEDLQNLQSSFVGEKLEQIDKIVHLVFGEEERRVFAAGFRGRTRV